MGSLGSAQGPGKGPDLAVTFLFDSALVRSLLEQLTWARHQVCKDNVDNLESMEARSKNKMCGRRGL